MKKITRQSKEYKRLMVVEKTLLKQIKKLSKEGKTTEAGIYFGIYYKLNTIRRQALFLSYDEFIKKNSKLNMTCIVVTKRSKTDYDLFVTTKSPEEIFKHLSTQVFKNETK